MDQRVFTRRSSAVALGTGVLVAAALGQFGAPWALAAFTGLPAGATVLGLSFGARNGLFRVRSRPWVPAPWIGAFLVGLTVVLVPAANLSPFLEMNFATEAALELLFGLTGFAALMFGYITRMLEELAAAEDTSVGSATPTDQHPAS